MYRLSEPFFEVLQGVGARRNSAYRWKEVLLLLLQYLMRRRPSLLDPTDNTRVLCAGDPIAAVFGVSQFTKHETKSLVRRHVIPVWAPGQAPVAGATASSAAACTAGSSGSVAPSEPGSSGQAPVAGATASSAAACTAGSSGSVAPSEPPSSAVKRPADADDDQESKRSRTTEDDGAASPSDNVGSDNANGPGDTISTAETDNANGPGDTISTAESIDVNGPGDTISTAETEPYERSSSADEGSSSVDEAEGAGDQLGDTYYHEMEPVDAVDDGNNSVISDSGESDLDESVPEPAYRELPGDDKGVLADEDTTSSHASGDNADPRQTRPAGVHEPTRRRRRSSRRCRHQRRLHAQLSRSDSAAAGSGSGSGAGCAAGPDSQQSVADADTSRACVVCCDRRRDVVLVHVRRVGCLVACYECARRLWKAGDRCPSCRCRITQIMRLR